MRDDYPEITARFAAETAKHEMTVLRDDGLYRHLHFAQPGRHGWSYWFQLTTVPGALIFQGDGDAFVFRRVEDMFEFFRHGIHRDGTRHINPDYWDEKLQADPKIVQAYSKAKFDAHVSETLAEAEETHPGVTKAWHDEVVDGWEYNTEYLESAQEALRHFEFGEGYRASCSCGDTEEAALRYDAERWGVRHVAGLGAADHKVSVESLTFVFDDDWHEWDLTDFHWWYLWACHAILWGIQQYDAAKAAPAEVGAS